MAHQVLNDDLLGLILKPMSIRELVRFEKVSQQMGDCVRKVLQSKTHLSVGLTDEESKDGDITKTVIRRKEVTSSDLWHKNIKYSYDMTARGVMLDTIFQKCSSIRVLRLKKVTIDWPTIDTILKWCSKLSELSLDSLEIPPFDKWTEQLSARITQLTLRDILADNYRQVLDNFHRLPALQEFCVQSSTKMHICLENIQTIYQPDNQILILQLLNEPINDTLVLTTIPDTLTRLEVEVWLLSEPQVHSMETFLSQYGHRLQSLNIQMLYKIEYSNEFQPLVNRLFKSISNNCHKLLTLAIKPFMKLADIPMYHTFNVMDSAVFTDNVSKLQHLKRLTIEANFTFNINSIRPTMPSLRHLKITSGRYRPSEWTNANKLWPNLKRITIEGLFKIHCECEEPSEMCDECFTQFLQYMPESVDRLDLFWMKGAEGPIIDGEDLSDIFMELQTIHFKYYPSIDELTLFCRQCLINRQTKSPLKLVLDTEMAAALHQILPEMADNSKIIHVYRF